MSDLVLVRPELLKAAAVELALIDEPMPQALVELLNRAATGESVDLPEHMKSQLAKLVF